MVQRVVFGGVLDGLFFRRSEPPSRGGLPPPPATVHGPEHEHTTGPASAAGDDTPSPGFKSTSSGEIPEPKNKVSSEQGSEEPQTHPPPPPVPVAPRLSAEAPTSPSPTAVGAVEPDLSDSDSDDPEVRPPDSDWNFHYIHERGFVVKVKSPVPEWSAARYNPVKDKWASVRMVGCTLGPNYIDCRWSAMISKTPTNTVFLFSSPTYTPKDHLKIVFSDVVAFDNLRNVAKPTLGGRYWLASPDTNLLFSRPLVYPVDVVGTGVDVALASTPPTYSFP